MAFEFKVQRRVEFSETDMAGIVHFSNFFKYMETVEHAFYRSLGFSAILRKGDPLMGLPRVHASCDYRKPIRFEDLLEIHLLVRNKRPKVLSYTIRFRNLSAQPPVDVAVGELTVVCVCASPDGSMVSAPLPEDLAAKIDIAPRELLGEG